MIYSSELPGPSEAQRDRGGEAARRLVELRDGWLNPPGLDPAELEKRTLTNLYNQRPTWLDHARAALDAAVFAACNWLPDKTDTDVLERLFALNLERSARHRGRRRRGFPPQYRRYEVGRNWNGHSVCRPDPPPCGDGLEHKM